MVISIGIVIFFAKRHRDPRLRPRKGEVLLVAIILFMGSGFFSHFTAELLTTDFDEERIKNKMKAAQTRGLSDPRGSGIRTDGIKERGAEKGEAVNLPSEAPKEFRKILEK
mgnify:CR=1 FL=1